jgi:hypothetical protein
MVSGISHAPQSGMNRSPYLSHYLYGDRVRFTGEDGHPRNGEFCTIIRVLPDPSERPECQWYDVRFDDGTFGRFLEKYISGADSGHKHLPREIPLGEWTQFFETFSGQHENWLVDLQTFNTANAQQLSTEKLRLKSISADSSRSESPMVVIVGESDSLQVSHLVRKPSRVVLTQNEAGVDESIDIFADKLHIIIRFSTIISSELVNGKVA